MTESVSHQDFRITTMGIRVLVTVIIVQVCLMNSRKIHAWPVVSLLSRGTAGLALSEVRVRDVNRAAAFFSDDGIGIDRGKQQFNQKLQKESSSGNWSELILTIQWPQAFCLDYNDSHTDNDACVVPDSVNDWTIHGLWPSIPGTVGPAFCNNTWKFDIQKISDLEGEMNIQWPNFIVNETFDSLWSHEWEKHGTCASSLPALYGEHNYFQQTLTLRKQYDILSMLQQGGIVPSSTHSYTYQTILSAVKSNIGTDPTITCVYDHKTKRVYLSQVEVCMDQKFNRVDCVPTKSRRGQNLGDEDCSHDKAIFYPPKN